MEAIPDGNPLEGEVSSVTAGGAVKQLLKKLSINLNHNYTGEEFFGLRHESVRKRLRLQNGLNCRGQAEQEEDLDQHRISPQSAGIRQLAARISRLSRPFSSLSPRFQRARIHLALKAVKDLLENNVSAFVLHLIRRSPNIIKDALFHSLSRMTQAEIAFILNPIRVHRSPQVMTTAESAQILVCSSLSQRCYNTLKKFLKRKNIFLKKHSVASTYIKNLEVGKIERKVHHLPDTAQSASLPDCMCVQTSTKGTLELVFKSKTLFEKMDFLPPEKQEVLFAKLKESDSHLFGNLDASKRTIFIRQTGDNYRSFRLPTQQISFNILNLKTLVNSPLGQFIQLVWRGPESRQSIANHCAGIFSELKDMSQQGVNLTLPDGKDEHFNVVVLYVADLSHMEKVLGRVSCTAKYGCMRCKKPSCEWAAVECETFPDGEKGQPISGKSVPAESLSLSTLQLFGQKAERQLGQNPREDSKVYTAFHQNHYGQIATLLLPSLVQETVPPCALHLILAMHRQFWKIIHSFTKSRKQETLIVPALKKIGCFYMAFQMESYVKTKGKQYDGSTTLRLTGNDCKRLEDNIDRFIETFIHQSSASGGQARTKVELFRELVLLWRPIAHELRDHTTTTHRLEAFNGHVEVFAKQLVGQFPTECSEKMVYFHILRDHVWPIMKFWFNTTGWGYGVFSSSAGEHLNKRLKVYEADHSNQSADRFYRLLIHFRVGMLHFPSIITQEVRSKVVCSACGAKGHNKKNKSCPNYISRQDHFIEDSDGEEEVLTP